ncbi:MAG: zeta toxin family protein [Alphaproteobacteria bacterium]|nr:zeta toxin family protein [Alphaproteobacteria bacterium]
MADQDKYRLAPDVIDRVYADICEKYLRDHASLQFPRFVIISGQTGAGKSTIFSIVEKKFDPTQKPVHVDMDELRKEHTKLSEIFQEHPFETAVHTNADAWEWTSRLLADAKAGRNNVIYETTLKSIDDTERMIRAFKKEDYAVDLHTIAANSKASIYGVFERYERDLAKGKAARFVDLDYHDAVYEVFPENVDRLETKSNLDLVTVYRRDGERLYLNDGKLSQAQAKDAIENERNRLWTEEEKGDLALKWRELKEHIEARADGPTKPEWYVQKAQEFSREAELFASARQTTKADNLDPLHIEEMTYHHIFTRANENAQLVCFDRSQYKNIRLPVRAFDPTASSAEESAANGAPTESLAANTPAAATPPVPEISSSHAAGNTAGVTTTQATSAQTGRSTSPTVQSGQAASTTSEKSAIAVNPAETLSVHAPDVGAWSALEKTNATFGTVALALPFIDAGAMMIDGDFSGGVKKASEAAVASTVMVGGMKLLASSVRFAKAVPFVGNAIGAGFSAKSSYDAFEKGDEVRGSYDAAKAALYGTATISAGLTAADCWNPTVVGPALVTAVTGGTALAMDTAETIYDHRKVVTQFAAKATEHVKGWFETKTDKGQDQDKGNVATAAGDAANFPSTTAALTEAVWDNREIIAYEAKQATNRLEEMAKALADQKSDAQQQSSPAAAHPTNSPTAGLETRKARGNLVAMRNMHSESFTSAGPATAEKDSASARGRYAALGGKQSESPAPAKPDVAPKTSYQPPDSDKKRYATVRRDFHGPC